MHWYLPLWDCHSGWDGRPIAVKLIDVSDFMITQRVRKLWDFWDGNELTREVVRITDDDMDNGSRPGSTA